MAVALGISADTLLLAPDERGPDDALKLQFEAVSRFDPESKKVVQQVLDSMILAAGSPPLVVGTIRRTLNLGEEGFPMARP